MSEFGPELHRLAIYKETTQKNMIPSYFPANFTRTAPSLKSVFKEAKKRQANSYSIEQIIEFPCYTQLPTALKHNFKETYEIYDADDQREPTRTIYTNHTDYDKFDTQLLDMNKLYNDRWHFTLNPDFTNVLCDSRYIQFQKIEINIKDKDDQENERLKQHANNQYNSACYKIKSYDNDILEGLQPEYNFEYQQWHMQNGGNAMTWAVVNTPDLQKKYWISRWEKQKLECLEQLRLCQEYKQKQYWLCSSISPLLRVGTLHEDKLTIDDTNHVYLLNPNAEFWIEDQFKKTLPQSDYVLDGSKRNYIVLKLIVENRH